MTSPFLKGEFGVQQEEETRKRHLHLQKSELSKTTEEAKLVQKARGSIFLGHTNVGITLKLS